MKDNSYTELFTMPLCNKLKSFTKLVKYKAGEKIFESGAEGGSCYFIEDGVIRIQLDKPELNSDGVIAHYEAGQVIGELSILDTKPRSASAYAETDVNVQMLSNDAIDCMFKEQPELALSTIRFLGQTASRRLRIFTEKYASVAFSKRDELVEDMVWKAKKAQADFRTISEKKLESLLIDLAYAVASKSRYYAELTVRHTLIGNVDHKTDKNRMASLGILGEILRVKKGESEQDDIFRKVLTLPGPVGVIFGLIPMTSPIATAIFKILIALKGRNAIILSPQRTAVPACIELAEHLKNILEKHNVPSDLVSWVTERTNRTRTQTFMAHSDVGLVLATGGQSMVQAAYRSGTPAYGVGPGNAPVLIAQNADVSTAAYQIARSKAFDNGLICGSENNLIVHQDRYDEFVGALEKSGCAVLKDTEVELLRKKAVSTKTRHLETMLIGQSADKIAAALGFQRFFKIKVLVVPVDQDEARSGGAFAREKMAPLVSLFSVENHDQGIKLAKELLDLEGSGHTAVIHTTDEDLVQKFAEEMPASRILVNTPASQGIVGATTGLETSFMLGCGTYGGNSTTDNVGLKHVVNMKRLAPHDPEGEAMLDTMDYINPGAAVLSSMLGFDSIEMEAEGCIVKDSRGKEYLDFLAGVGVMNLGHRHPRVIKAVQKQLNLMPFSSKLLFNQKQSLLAKKLAQIAPGDLQYSFFSNSGTEAVEAALKLARAASNRPKIVSTCDAFHGKTFGALSASGREVFKLPFEPLLPGFEHVPYGDVDALEKILDKDVAAFILEPIQGEGGVRVPPVGYLRTVRQLCDKYGVLLILDEVQTGIGRCGYLFACEHEGIQPDLLCLAKGLSGGVIPIGVTMGNSKVWQVFEENPFIHSSTFGGNPLACTAALTTLEVIEDENLCSRATEMGAYLTKKLNEIQKKYPSILKEIRGIGLLIGVEFTDENVGQKVLRGMAKRGVIAAYTLNQPRVIRFEPPLIVTETQCDQAIKAFVDSLLS